MTTHDISTKVMEEIRAKHLTPLARWRARIGSMIFWCALSCALVVGSLAFSVILFLLTSDLWETYRYVGSWIILRQLPYLWIIAFIGFILLGEYTYRKTALGHRTRLSRLVGAYLALTMVFGSAVYILGVGDWIESALRDRVPIYRGLVHGSTEVWNHPEHGLLFGTLSEVTPGFVVVKTPSGTRYTVDVRASAQRGNVPFATGTPMKFLGKMTGEGQFTATEVRPARGGGFRGGRGMSE